MYTSFNYSHVHEKYFILYKVNVKVVLHLSTTTISAVNVPPGVDPIAVDKYIYLYTFLAAISFYLLLLLKCLTKCWRFKKGLTSNKLIFSTLKYGRMQWLCVCWDCEFESRRGHGCLSVVSVVCCQVEVSASVWSLVQKSPTKCGVSERDRETLTMRRSWQKG